MNDQDQAIEAQIKAAGADVAPRVTPADVHANIDSEHYFTAWDGAISTWNERDINVPGDELKLLTFCVLVLRNGFTVTGEAACVSPENFDAVIGRKIAWENAVAKIWPLMGYALKERLEGLQAGDVADAKTSGFREGYASAMRGDPEPMGNGAEA